MKIDASIKELTAGLGLDEYELRLYAAAVELGGASASRLAKRTGIPRTSAYSGLDRLQHKGFVSLEQRGSVQIFLPASPDTLVFKAEERLAEAQAAVQQAKQVSEMLRSSQGRDAMTSSKVLMVEGREAVRSFLYTWEERWRQSVIELRKPWAGFQDEAFLEHYGDWVEHYWQRFSEAKDRHLDKLQLFSDEQTTTTKKVASRVARTAPGRRHLRPLKGMQGFSASLWIVGEYIVLLRTRSDPHYALQVRDLALAENVRVVFDRMWDYGAQASHLR